MQQIESEINICLKLFLMKSVEELKDSVGTFFLEAEKKTALQEV